MIREVRNHLTNGIIPFWKSLRDNEYGGYYGYMGHDLTVDKKAVKGCILNSRILWFFSNAHTLLKNKALLSEADHAYGFLKEHCIDREYGGVFWSVSYDGKPEDVTKHTYNQAFAVYALSSYYEASRDPDALGLAKDLYELIETKCRDEGGYLEAQDREFHPAENDKLSENGVMADRTMNTLLHVMEAYTELYRVSGMPEVKASLEAILDLYSEHIYNPSRHRQEVFFDRDYHSLIDLCSYGHDIESAWLLDRTLSVIGEARYSERFSPVTKDLTDSVYRTAFDGHSLANECERGTVSDLRIWWVQAEALVGFLNGCQKDPSKEEYLHAARAEWDFISSYVIDKRKGSEWFPEVTPAGSPVPGAPLVEPWKCPYHNGRMCFEIIKRGIE
ncbi:MAG: AGE family epimerase/isomerase [Lachnospiraceae bacterium]|nr:AGE family epimerase/isomerase [Lachnospiraceae bacterium]